MVFCSSCGQQLADGAKFCHNCGKQIEMTASTYKRRNEEYAGKIVKCPACGQELSSTDAICPSCGHEMNEVRIHPILEKFINNLNECDSNIAQDEAFPASNALKEKAGWSSWKAPMKVLWIVFNCLTLCAPLVFRYVVIKNRHNDITNTTIKQNLIENFQIPNEREAIIATLNFIRGKVIALSSQKVQKETWRWIKLWSAKASQIHKQAVELLSNDVIVENIYRDVVLEVRNAKKAFNNRVLLTSFLGIIYIAAICCFNIYFFRRISRVDFDLSNKEDHREEQVDEKEVVNWSDMFLSEYFPEPVLINANVYSNSREECWIGQIDCSQSEYYAYCRQCKEWGFDYEVVEEDENWFTAYNLEGYKVHVAYTSITQIY